ncbi:paxu protein [Colletotrichum truncatum]|uniref:Paxu protein n=1 Tax=Colletotrichum truncatum TaxID=5467 RepID=A0ACC3ZBB4_COLTU|nr:paxu protein [Colletotrichum truncatum]KAF6787700.1 paxu protein [Colletotrichum truncatum]
MSPKPMPFPGFTALNDQIFVRDGEELAEGATRPTDHPRVVIIYSWGDAIPKHVVKYTDGYRKLYPHAKQIAILSPILKAITQSVEQRADSMRLVIDAAYPPESVGAPDEDAVLSHGMSNTGAINYASALKAYHDKYNKPMPHRLAVWDSTPGSPYMTWETLKRWANAAAMAVAPFVPLPYVVTQTIVGFLLAVHRGYQLMVGSEPAPVFSSKVANDTEFVPETLRRLYLYSKDDRIIAYHEVEENIAIAQEKGFMHNAVTFEGSDHVGHMRMFPERYWGAIQASWKEVA